MISENSLDKPVGSSLITTNNQSKLLLMDDAGNFELALLDARERRVASSTTPLDACRDASASKTFKSSKLKIACSSGSLILECENSELAVALVQSLVIDRLHLELHSVDEPDQLRFSADVEPVLDELYTLAESSRQLEESERRIETELYELADHTKNLMLQFGTANELNEL